MSRRTLLALASLSAIALDGCLLNWNQFRAGDAAADTAVADSRTDTGVREDTGVPADTGIDTGVETDTGVDTGVPTDTMTAMDATDASDARSDVQDSGVPADATDAARDATADADPGCTGPVVVNEVVHTGTSGTDEFIEIRNNGTCTVDLAGWRLQYLASSGTMSGSSPQVLFLAGDTIAPGREVIVASTASPLAPMAMRTFSAGIAQSGGAIGLFNQRMERVDSVAYGSLSVDGGHPYAEPIGNVGAPTYTSGPESISRFPNGTDTNNNAMDFHRAAMSTPGAPNM